MLDYDLAKLYSVRTKALNQAVKRNIERFPTNFMFQLTDSEKTELVTICDHLKQLKFSSTKPFVFTEQGVAMLSAVLKSNAAVLVSIRIMDAFVSMRKFLLVNARLFQKINFFEQKILDHDSKFEKVFKLIEDKDIKPEKGIFFDGQIFDAYKFVSDLIRSAKKSIVLFDNFIDDTVLTLFSKRRKNVSVCIYTKNIDRKLKLDLEKFNSQYEPINVKEFSKSHDRFMILDGQEVYYIGASLKDLGKKWFGFSKFDINLVDLIDRTRK
jgi:hypothetical protein